MSSVLKYGLFLMIFSNSCISEVIYPDQEEEDVIQITEGLCILFGDSILINNDEIDYYDFSTHMIYLKEPHEFLQDKYNWEAGWLSFSIYANKEKVYTGSLYPAWSSSVPTPAYIDFPFIYPGYVIKINYSEFYSQVSNKSDPRGDEKIIKVLKDYDLYHAGLACSIDEIDIQPNGQLSFTFTVTNNDTFNYYVLSPDKMGIRFFHYFTNGLMFWNETTSWLQHNCTVIHPDPWDSWNVDWMEIIASGERKSYDINYYSFDTIPSGQYQVSFTYPGLRNVEIDEINQTSGRIWLGGVTSRIERFVE